ncbi:MAG: heme ABC transporter ATP-binding protein [Planctomycetes bacterium]|nr:heme ABC transporter ATP-binding protein [Planctomycetota bacterium]
MICTSRLSVIIGGQKILKEVSFDIHHGELACVIGPNGAGKSTLIRAMSGDLKPCEGEVMLAGDPIHRLALGHLARRRAVVTQDTSVPFSFRAAEVIALGLTPWSLSHSEAEDIISLVSDLTDVRHLLERDIQTLSGGERQRVQLARALAQLWPGELTEQALLLDEPLSALDMGQQSRTLALLRKLRERELTIVCVMHDLNAALSCADRLLVLKDGALIADEHPRRLDLPLLLSQTFETPLEQVNHGPNESPIIIPVTTHRSLTPTLKPAP